MWELWGIEILAFPLTWHIAYTTACCYRTTRDHFWAHACTVHSVWIKFCKWPDYDFCISQGNVATVLRRGGQNWSFTSSVFTM